MFDAISCYNVEQRVVAGETVWVAIRARGAEWSWLTPEEAAQIGEQWVEDTAKGRAGRLRPMQRGNWMLPSSVPSHGPWPGTK
jgi:hypothetical protein